MLQSLLLASELWLMSDRASFWNPDKISKHTEVMQDSPIKNEILTSQKLKGKNVLLIVHGYNNNAEDALSTYRLINVHVSGFKGRFHPQFYDYVIGYLWPGYDEGWEYFRAKHHIPKLAEKMRAHLEFLCGSADKVDVLAHSMGNFLMFEALDYRASSFITKKKKIVQNFYALAPAVDDESIEKKEKYDSSMQNCEKVFIFYSKRDEVLKWLYTAAEWDRALGSEGAEDPEKLPQNVELINYTKFIGGHDQYFTSLPVYEFIKNQFQQKPHHVSFLRIPVESSQER